LQAEAVAGANRSQLGRITSSDCMSVPAARAVRPQRILGGVDAVRSQRSWWPHTGVQPRKPRAASKSRPAEKFSVAAVSTSVWGWTSRAS